MTVLTMFTMIFVVRSNNLLMAEKRYGFYIIFIMIAADAVAEWMGVFANNGIPGWAPVHIAAKFCEFTIAPVIPIILVAVVDSKNSAKYLIPVIALHTLLEFTSIFNGCVFNITSENAYSHGPIYFMYYAVAAFCSFYMFWIFSKVSRHFQNRNLGILLLIMVFMVISCITHIIFDSVRIQWIGMAICSIFVYIYYNELIYETDPLTGMLNRACYEAHMAAAKRKVMIFIFDVDRFKDINDTYGHHYGDMCLQAVAECIIAAYHPYGHCYRTGGDEFAAVLDRSRPGRAEAVDPERLNGIFVEKLMKAREKKNYIPTVSIGYTEFDPLAETIQEAVDRADSIMYHYKSIRHNTADQDKKKVTRIGAYMTMNTDDDKK